MKLELRGRQAGKTTEAIKIAHETEAYILVPSKKQAQHVSQLAESMGLHIRYPVTWEEFESVRHTGLVKNLVIDNADQVLDQIFPYHTIQLVTWTQPTTPEGEKETI